MPVRTEVTTGVFDPRTYKENDVVHWAKRRKSSWLAWPGTIKYTRERTVEEEEDREEERDGDVAFQKKDKFAGQEKKEIKACGRKGAREIKINVQKKNIQKKNVRRAHSVDIWPRRTRTDITELYH